MMGDAKRITEIGNQETIEINWAVDNLISRENPTFIYGEGGSYKSLVALHLAICLQNGLPFNGKETKKGDVLLLSLEGYFDLAPRYKAHSLVHGEPKEAPFAHYGPYTHENEKHRDWLKKQLVGKRYLIIDTLSLSVEGDISAGNTAPFVTRKLRLLSDWHGVTPIVIHHTGKDKAKGMKGASEFFNNVATVLYINDKKIKVKKQRSGKTGEVLAFDVVEKAINKEGQTAIALEWVELEDSLQKQIQQRIEEVLDAEFDGLTNKDLFNKVFSFFEGKKTKQNIRTQYNRAKKTLMKTHLIKEVPSSDDKEDTLIISTKG